MTDPAAGAAASTLPLPSASPPSDPLPATSHPGPVRPRAELIRTAIVFLQNPRVASTASDEKKRLFLRSKSLTDDEIETALALAADPQSAADAAAASLKDADDRGVNSGLPILVAAAPEAPRGGGGWGLTLIVVGGLSYGLYYLYVKYVVPFLRRQKKAEEKLATLEESVRALQDSVSLTLTRMQSSVEKLEASFQRQGSLMNEMEARLRHNQSQLAAEVRSEVTSLKGVWLNVRNFPAPKTGVVETASTRRQVGADARESTGGRSATPPAWQLTPSTREGAALEGKNDDDIVGSESAPRLSSSESAPRLSSSESAPRLSADVAIEAVVVVATTTTAESAGKSAGASTSASTLSRPPQTTTSRSATSSGSSATSFEVIETKDCRVGSVVVVVPGDKSGESSPLDVGVVFGGAAGAAAAAESNRESAESDESSTGEEGGGGGGGGGGISGGSGNDESANSDVEADVVVSDDLVEAESDGVRVEDGSAAEDEAEDDGKRENEDDEYDDGGDVNDDDNNNGES